ncbi:MAG: hypothetical protein QOF89_629 [Acidobacteriota bacterium]|jgi:hypothetical protein|nr:hypothetical protein [Acidobacteriota bacterium]
MRSRVLLSFILLLGSLRLGAAEAPRPLDAKIVNGSLDFLHPTVGLLVTNDGLCSATLIGCQTVLTAAHCICTLPSGVTLDGTICRARSDLLDPSRKSFFLQHAGSFAVASVEVNPAFLSEIQGDEAILRLASPVPNIAPTPIDTVAKPAAGTAGEIVGFGTTQGGLRDFGLKRRGAVTIAACSGAAAGHVCWDFRSPIGLPGTSSNTCSGDSGGPLFTPEGGRQVVSGVTSFGNANCLPNDNSHDADVFRDSAWIQSQAGADLAATACGAGPQVGSAGTAVLGASGTLSLVHPQDAYTLEVPAGTAQLRISANSSSLGRSGLALYARQGAPASPTAFDCKDDLHGALPYCEIHDPAPGTWHLLLTGGVSGSGGAYQLTATLIAQQAASGACVPGLTTLCLEGGRFKVEGTFQTPDGQLGSAKTVKLTEETGYLWFFSDTNVEAVVKILNACTFNQRFWVFAGGLTNVQTTLTVTDTATGLAKTYQNPQSTAFQPIQDTSAFATCPGFRRVRN